MTSRMTVADLISVLQQLPPDAEIAFDTGAGRVHLFIDAGFLRDDNAGTAVLDLAHEYNFTT